MVVFESRHNKCEFLTSSEELPNDSTSENEGKYQANNIWRIE